MAFSQGTTMRLRTMSSLLLLLSLLLVPFVCFGLSVSGKRCTSSNIWGSHHHYSSTTALFATRKQSKTSDLTGSTAALLDQEETPAGIAGAEVFGGNRQKEELYDADAEAKAEVVLAPKKDVYHRFDDPIAFTNAMAKNVAESLQNQINAVLYEQPQDNGEESSVTEYSYSPNLKWITPFDRGSSSNPLQELNKALEFYNRIDVAIVSATSLDPTTVNVRWQVSVVWPNFWEARVLVSGTSQLTLDDNNVIVAQTDTLDQGDVLQCVTPQVTPRFWDTYHIGMTPSAQVQPRLESTAKKGLLSNYNLYETSPRLVYRPSLLDIGSREDAYAQAIPNHAFTTVIKTMGPQRQRYVTTSPVEVQISRDAANNSTTTTTPRITWTIPLAVELLSNAELPMPGDDPETPAEACAECRYEYQPRRRVATVPYGGFPQDAQVAEVRKKLYEQVVKDGLKPKVDKAGRPQFFFVQNDAKACFTEGGLGMAVYDWRPQFVKANEVGMELEMEEEQ